jgi:hypothetical protein
MKKANFPVKIWIEVPILMRLLLLAQGIGLFVMITIGATPENFFWPILTNFDQFLANFGFIWPDLAQL